MSQSKIEWTEDTWNPIVGCSILSPGCTHCYAMKMAARIEAMNAEARSGHATAPQYTGTTTKVNGRAVWTGKLAMAGDNILLQPLKRKKPTTYFVNSMGDLFHEDCPDEWIDRVFAVMALSPQHTFQVLTKRAKRMRDYMTRGGPTLRTLAQVPQVGRGVMTANTDWPLPNVWLGVSTERQQEAEERIPLLLKTPAAVRFVSAEPLLGPIDLDDLVTKGDGYEDHHSALECDVAVEDDEEFHGATLDWVIVGGESGSDARPMHPDWARSLRQQCQAAGVAFFFKQWGAFVPIIDRDNDDPYWRRDYTRADEFPDRFKILNLAGGCGFHGERVHLMQRYGKKAAGRQLDGQEHNGMPSRAAADRVAEVPSEP